MWLAALGPAVDGAYLGTSVLTPTMRYHPSIVAQAFGTLGCLAPGRVFLGVGTGESLNETPATGAEWPGAKERRLRLGRMKGGDLLALIQHLVRAGIQSLPSDEGRLYDRLVGGVERELIEQVMQLCDNVQVKAAARLGINRNTLHKKLSEFTGPDSQATEAEAGT